MSKIAPQFKNHIFFGLGRDADPSLPSSAVRHERVELYLCSPYGPYGLYRASVELYLYSPYGPYGLYKASVSVQGVHFNKKSERGLHVFFEIFAHVIDINGLLFRVPNVFKVN